MVGQRASVRDREILRRQAVTRWAHLSNAWNGSNAEISVRPPTIFSRAMLRWVSERNADDPPRKGSVAGFIFLCAWIVAAPIVLFIDPIPAPLAFAYLTLGAVAGVVFLVAEEPFVGFVALGVFIFGIDAATAIAERADPMLLLQPWHSAVVPGSAMFAVLLFPEVRAFLRRRANRNS